MNSIRVLLVDDHRLVCAGLRLILKGLQGIEVIGEAHDGREALALIKAHHPDLALMDIAMKELNGLGAAIQVRNEFPEVRVILLSTFSSEEHVLQGLQAGVAGYLLKESAPEELEQAIRMAMRGEIYLSPPISKQVIGDYIQRVSHRKSPLDDLAFRHREVLQLIAEGHSTKEIASKLHLSVKTVETHRAGLMKRLGIYDIAGLVRYAIRTGLVSIDS